MNAEQLGLQMAEDALNAKWVQLAPDAYEADIDAGLLNVWADPKGWNYGVVLGHMTWGTRLDPPEFVEDVDIIVSGFATKADAQFAAIRHADRLIIMDAINGWWADEQLAEAYREEQEWQAQQ